MSATRKALLVATYDYRDPGLRRLVAPAQDAEALAEVLRDPAVAGFDVTVLLNQPAHVVGEAIADFYGNCRRDDLTVLYFSGHGLKDDDGRLYLAMTNTRRDALLFTGLAAAQIDEAMTACVSRRKVLILDCCYSGAFPAGHTAKGDESVHTLERFQGKGRAVLTASDSTQYSFEGENVTGTGAGSLFTRFLVEGMRSGEADLDADGDIALDELYSYVHDRVVTEMPQQRPKKQEDVDGRIVLARNVHWSLPAYVRNAIDSPIAAQRRAAVDELARLHRVGNELVRAAVRERLTALADDDSRAVSTAAGALLARLEAGGEAPAPDPVPPEPAAAVAPQAPAPEPAPSSPPPAVPAAREPVAREPVAAAPPGLSLPALLVSLIALAAALLVASRVLAIEGTYGYSAESLAWSTPNWLVQVVAPLVVAIGAVVVGRGRSRGVVLGCGVLAGVTLSLAGQLVMSALAFYGSDVGYRVGPGWWAVLVAACLLAAGVVAGVAREPALRRRAGRRRDVRGVVGAVVVAAIAVGWLFIPAVSDTYGWWVYLRVPGLVLAIACLALTALHLTGDQRRFGLAAVTVVAAWLVEAAVEGLISHPSGSRPVALLVSLLAVLVSVGVAYAAQVRLGEAPPVAVG